DVRRRYKEPGQISAAHDPCVWLRRQFRAPDTGATKGCDQPHLPRPHLIRSGARATPQTLESGSRYDLRAGLSPDAPDESLFKDDKERAFGYCHSYANSSRYDGPGLRVVLFVSGCLLRCTYCHNPDTWHLKDGTYVSAQFVLDRLAGFAPALKALDGGLTISGGEPLVQMAFTRQILAGAKAMGLHTALETSGFLGDKVDDDYLSQLDLVLLDIKSFDPETYRNATG